MNRRPERARREPADAPGTPLDSLLEEMRELRLTLAADLSLAAGAAEAGAEGVAADIVEADRMELARFARVADQRLRRLEGLATPPERPTPAWRRRVAVALPVVPVASALALSAAAATGALPLPGGSGHQKPPAAVSAMSGAQSGATSTFNELASVIEQNPSASQVLAVASKLHRQIAQLIASSPNNPAGAAEVAQLIHMEQALLMRAQPPGAAVVLKETRKLAARLNTVAPELVSPSTSPTGIPTVVPTHKPTHAASPKPSSSPKASPKPSATPSAGKSGQPSGEPSPPWPTVPN